MAITIEKNEKFHVIENDESFVDVFSDSAGLTCYNSNGTDLVNLTFLSNKVTSYADEHGRPNSSRIELKRVSSVTMTIERAIALRDMLINSLPSVTKDEK